MIKQNSKELVCNERGSAYTDVEKKGIEGRKEQKYRQGRKKEGKSREMWILSRESSAEMISCHRVYSHFHVGHGIQT